MAESAADWSLPFRSVDCRRRECICLPRFEELQRLLSFARPHNCYRRHADARSGFLPEAPQLASANQQFWRKSPLPLLFSRRGFYPLVIQRVRTGF
jgi:hypothetical protein